MVIFSGRTNRRRNGGADGALAIPAILPPNTNGRWPNGNYGVDTIRRNVDPRYLASPATLPGSTSGYCTNGNLDAGTIPENVAPRLLESRSGRSRSIAPEE